MARVRGLEPLMLRVTTTLLLCSALAAPSGLTALGAADYFGEDHWSPSDEPGRGVIRAALRDGPLPPFVHVISSGAGLARDRIEPAAAGLVLRPDAEHGTCGLELDLGADALSVSVSVHELDRGGTFALLLRALDDDGSRFQAALARDGDGVLTLSLRTRTAARWVQIPGAHAVLADARLPLELIVDVDDGALTARAAGVALRADAEFPEGLGLDLAVTDRRARIHSLEVRLKLNQNWAQGAAARLEARRALMRLREHAALGLLAGLLARAHPALEEELGALAEPLQGAWLDAAALGPLAGAADMLRVANAAPDSAALSHHAGLAALAAGRYASGRALLARAQEKSPLAETRLALAEALRGTGELDAANALLHRVRDELPRELAPDYALLRARLLAEKGAIGEASVVLDSALGRHADHERLEAFAASAGALSRLQGLSEFPEPGPLGLRVRSDLPPELLAPVLARLSPHLEHIRRWLPGLPQTLQGNLLVYADAVGYLSAALIVAGDRLDNAAGMFLRRGPRDMPAILLCRAFGEDELMRTLVHELWHLAAHAAGLELPRWLDEGMAVMLSAGIYRDGLLHFDTLPAEFAELQDAPALLTPEFIAGALAGPAYAFTGADARGHYLAAWAAVWFHARTLTRADLLRQALAGQEGAREALAAAAREHAPEISRLAGALRRP
jgi:hypothetical protein